MGLSLASKFRSRPSFEELFPARKLIMICVIIALLFWMFSGLRHSLLQSNAYDLGLFDQWIWLASRGLPQYSSMEGSHLLADHGAWLLYIAAIPYCFNSSVQWLLASQAIALSFTAIPIWCVGRQAGLPNKHCWLVCTLWWLQPVVLNVNLFDFHPEVWVMPALAASYWFCRSNRPWVWFVLLVVLLGARDGLVLVVGGIGFELALRRKWTWSCAAIGLSLMWLCFLNKFLYPLLTGSNTGPKAAAGLFSYLGDTLDEVIVNLVTNPSLVFENLDWIGGFIYLVLISVSLSPFWRQSSLPVLLGGLPLVVVNLLSEESPQRTLIHHYSLPLAVIGVIAAIDGIAVNRRKNIPFRSLVWSALCWAVLSKPWFFTGPYLERLEVRQPFNQAMLSIPTEGRLLTTSYFIPHLSHRKVVDFPRVGTKFKDYSAFDIFLLNPEDPGWGSSSQVQKDLLLKANEEGWLCKQWPVGIELCEKVSINETN
ncbi:DUF2079 domain-containing protein [Prochlorococcus sp. MIT 1300]|uniref:DUF2079 domain-containing protein n=1 Tax=Prochlorococcus sp. MIT 1300 TaxID=3096218 RepID=UPI002A758FB2|nr:DUF2079 domain-containing protein [Prochlorococcus sp. MIT 1300]